MQLGAPDGRQLYGSLLAVAAADERVQLPHLGKGATQLLHTLKRKPRFLLLLSKGAARSRQLLHDPCHHWRMVLRGASNKPR